MGVRRLASLAAGLPAGGALHRAVDPEGWQWTQDTELLATVLEAVDAGNRMYHDVHTKPGTQSPTPVKVPRPGQHKPRAVTREATEDDMKQKFGKSIKYAKEQQ